MCIQRMGLAYRQMKDLLYQRCSILHLAALFLCILASWGLVTGCGPLDATEPSLTVVNVPDVNVPSESALSVNIDAPNGAQIGQEAEAITIEITSPKGMGNAQIQLPSPPREQEIRVRFFLKGLERFVIETDTQRLMASASSIEPL